MHCPSCDKLVKKYYGYCSYCGTELDFAAICEGCGDLISKDWNNCIHCGKESDSLNDSQAVARKLLDGLERASDTQSPTAAGIGSVLSQINSIADRIKGGTHTDALTISDHDLFMEHIVNRVVDTEYQERWNKHFPKYDAAAENQFYANYSEEAEERVKAAVPAETPAPKRKEELRELLRDQMNLLDLPFEESEPVNLFQEEVASSTPGQQEDRLDKTEVSDKPTAAVADSVPESKSFLRGTWIPFAGRIVYPKNSEVDYQSKVGEIRKADFAHYWVRRPGCRDYLNDEWLDIEDDENVEEYPVHEKKGGWLDIEDYANVEEYPVHEKKGGMKYKAEDGEDDDDDVAKAGNGEAADEDEEEDYAEEMPQGVVQNLIGESFIKTTIVDQCEEALPDLASQSPGEYTLMCAIFGDHDSELYVPQREYTGFKKTLTDMLDTLGKSESAILVLRYGLEGDDERTPKSVGLKLGLSEKRVLEMTDLALRNLRHPSRSHKLRQYILSR